MSGRDDNMVLTCVSIRVLEFYQFSDMTAEQRSFLAIEGLHVFITGAAGGIGSSACIEFLKNGCRVTAFDRRAIDIGSLATSLEQSAKLNAVQGDLTSEASIEGAFSTAIAKFGPPNILVANAGITDESAHPPIWEIDVDKWDKVNTNNVRGTFLTIKHFLLAAKAHQEATKTELENLAIVVTGSETGKFGQEGHAEYASGKAGLQYGLVRGVKNEIVRLNSKARINAVAPGWVDTALIGDRLDDPKDKWEQAQSTVALKKLAQPEDVARTMAFLASHRAAGHISGECISVDGGMEGRLIWREDAILGSNPSPTGIKTHDSAFIASSSLSPPTRPRRLRICLSVDFDALSGYLGTGHSPHNTLSDHSAGIFSAKVGVPRLLSLFAKHKISDKLTWFIPGHSMETFPTETQSIISSGAEIALHGYSHEGAYAMTPEQENSVLEKCIELATSLKKGKQPVGYRAPLYQIRESTVKLLQEHNFLYDTSMNAHDSLPYFLPSPFPTEPPDAPDYTKAAGTWMHPTALPTEPIRGSTEAKQSLVEIPGSWYTEDMTPLGFYPYTPNSQGYVSVDAVEKMWWDRFEWLWENECFTETETDNRFGSIYPMIWHPESAGRSHIVGMIDRFLGRLAEKIVGAGDGEITFETFESVARAWRGDD